MQLFPFSARTGKTVSREIVFRRSSTFDFVEIVRVTVFYGSHAHKNDFNSDSPRISLEKSTCRQLVFPLRFVPFFILNWSQRRVPVHRASNVNSTTDELNADSPGTFDGTPPFCGKTAKINSHVPRLYKPALRVTRGPLRLYRTSRAKPPPSRSNSRIRARRSATVRRITVTHWSPRFR